MNNYEVIFAVDEALGIVLRNILINNRLDEGYKELCRERARELIDNLDNIHARKAIRAKYALD